MPPRTPRSNLSPDTDSSASSDKSVLLDKTAKADSSENLLIEKVLTQKLLTPAEAAKLRGISRAAIYKAISQGRLPHQLILGRIALREADVLEWIESGTKPGRPRGIPMTDQTKAVVGEAQRRRWSENRGS